MFFGWAEESVIIFSSVDVCSFMDASLRRLDSPIYLPMHGLDSKSHVFFTDGRLFVMKGSSWDLWTRLADDVFGLRKNSILADLLYHVPQVPFGSADEGSIQPKSLSTHHLSHKHMTVCRWLIVLHDARESVNGWRFELIYKRRGFSQVSEDWRLSYRFLLEIVKIILHKTDFVAKLLNPLSTYGLSL